jgi:TolB-like protein
MVMRAAKARRNIKHQDIRLNLLDRSSPRQEKSTAIRVPNRSIAVLPFSSLSDDKGDTYFADGVQDEILSNLAKVSQLKVISRTSVMTFRPGDNRNLRSIAESLGVANVVEGTVRRDGKRVRLTIRLVDARKDKALWADSYERDLTDIFAIQSEIAQQVASRLRAQLSPEERKDIEEKPTENLDAYDLYLQAKQLYNSIPRILPGRRLFPFHRMKETLTKAINLLEQATRKDPQFALAYCLIANAQDTLYVNRIDYTPERRALGDAALNEAMRLRPDLPEVHLVLAYHLNYLRDFERARVQLAIAARSLPNNSDVLTLTAVIDEIQGHWEKATAGLERAATLDPRDPDVLNTLGSNYVCLRRYRDIERILDRLIDLYPDQPVLQLVKANCAFEENADVKAARAACEAVPPSVKGDPSVAGICVYISMCARDFAAAEEILNESPDKEIVFLGAYVPRQIYTLWVEFLRGNHPSMEHFGAAREQLYRKVEADPTNPYLVAALSYADMALGHKEESIQEGQRATEMWPISEDALHGPTFALDLAALYGFADQSDAAFQQLNVLIKMPSESLHYGYLKTHPDWDPLRKDPRFEKLLAQLAPNESLQKPPSSPSRVRTNKRSVRSGPKKISIARLPVTGSDLFGREEDIAFLDRAWANKDVNVVTIVAWAGVGKSTLTNHWLRRMAADHYRSAELVFGWSFYRQGASGETSSADDFLDAALTWFGDPDPRFGTGWQRGERLAKLVAHCRTLLVLDGMEPLQNPPGAQEGRLREPSLQALLRQLAAFNKGLCLITTRTPLADIADHEGSSALRRDLEQLSSEAGARLLRALGVRGDEAELRIASDEFSGHCLALTLLGSYLTDAFNGDIRFRKEVSDRLARDIRQGAHAQKVMESYQNWFGEGPELSVLRMLGLFDRPADEKAIAPLLELPGIPGLTESLTDLSQIEWRTLIARLRRARLLAAEDPNNPGNLDAHPLVREYFGGQLRSLRIDAWKEVTLGFTITIRRLRPSCQRHSERWSRFSWP